MIKKILFLLVFVLFSCKEETKYLYHYDPLPKQEVDDRIYPLSLIQGDKNVDILFVIDNSGSMYNIQQNVINNSKTFMTQFATQQFISWKIGIVSTDDSESPYLGFDQSFDWTMLNPSDPNSFDRMVNEFQGAVSDLGISGSGYEMVFYNVKRQIDRYDGSNGRPSFLRPNSHLAVIMISDEVEQSETYKGSAYEATNFLKSMSSYVDQSKILRFYGAISQRDLTNCTSSGDFGTYAGSPYEKIINLTNGFVISACIPDFGLELAKIGKDIASFVGLPSLLLRKRPKPETIKVYYQDKLLPPGTKENGGLWFYVEDTNTINFYSLDFLKDVQNDHFKIEFDVNDGIPREE